MNQVGGRWFDRTDAVQKFRERESDLGDQGKLDPLDQPLGVCIRKNLNNPPPTDYDFHFRQDGDDVVVTRTNPDGTTEDFRFNPSDIQERGYDMNDVWARLTEDITSPGTYDPRSVHAEIISPR